MWLTKSKYVDIETGEEITEREAKLNYIIIKKKKHGRTEKRLNKVTGNKENIGIIEITNECRKAGRQLEFEW